MVQPLLPPVGGATGEARKAALPFASSRDAPPHSARDGGGGGDTSAVLRHKLEKSNELVKTLKQVVRAQHSKLEELQAKVASIEDTTGGGVLQVQLEESVRRESEENARERERLEAQVRRLTNQVQDLRASNKDLKAAKDRLAAMLAQVGEPRFEPPRSVTSEQVDAPTPSMAGEHHLASMHSSPEPRKPSVPAVAAEATKSRISLALVARSCIALWKAPSVPRGLLKELLHSASHILDAGGASLSVTLFISDPWLRFAMDAAEDHEGLAGDHEMMHPHVKFYLAGKVALHAYRRGAGRPDPPLFSELAQLPLRRGSMAIVLPLQAAQGRPVLGALQVLAPDRLEKGQQSPEHPASARRAQPAREEVGGAAGGASGSQTARDAGAPAKLQPSLSPGQVDGIQLLVSTASGIVDMHCRGEASRLLQTRSRGLLSIAAEVHEARNLADFEMVVKTRVARFFGVATVRLSFYAPETQELLSMATRAQKLSSLGEGSRKAAAVAGRRNLTRVSINDGIVGKSLRKQKVFHVDPVFSSPNIHEEADGVTLEGRDREINMLCGPLVAHMSGEEKVVGVMQLLDKRLRVDSEVSVESFMVSTESNRGFCDPFNQVDEGFFVDLLKIVGAAAHRTMQAQALRITQKETEMPEIGVEQLLMG